MEYRSILDRIENDKKNDNISEKLFRYTGLMQAIEFFSQRLNFEQIIDSAFDFVNELLTLEKSAIFIFDGNNYIARKLKGHEGNTNLIKSSKSLADIAALHGTLIHDKCKLENYFDKEILESYSVTITIPLIIENYLTGFIFISNKALGDLNSDDYIIAEALMRLVNNALENCKRYEELQNANKELDEKIFNLFAINQSSKALLSELTLDVLYNLSVDVFSELTQSSKTAFILYDDGYEKYIAKAYKDIYLRQNQINVELVLNSSARIDVNRVIIDVSNEMDLMYFNNIFPNGTEILKDLKPLYIVFLIKNGKILGMVTLSETVTGYKYKKSMFELIESLASSTYIALSNAMLLKKVNEQKKLLQTKLDKLISLNTLMKNINSSANLQTLLELTLKTLEISFGVEKALIALYHEEENALNIYNKLNINTAKTQFHIRKKWDKILAGEFICEAKSTAINEYIDKEISNNPNEDSGILIIPISIENIKKNLIGVIVIFKFRDSLINEEENLLTLETISNHIAPVMWNFYNIERQKKFLLPNYIELFKDRLRKEISLADELLMDLYIVQIRDSREFIFKENTLIKQLEEEFEKIYPIYSNYVFMLANDYKMIMKIEEIARKQEINVFIIKYREHFNKFEEFFKIF